MALGEVDGDGLAGVLPMLAWSALVIGSLWVPYHRPAAIQVGGGSAGSWSWITVKRHESATGSICHVTRDVPAASAASLQSLCVKVV